MIIRDGKSFMENVVMQFRAPWLHCGYSFSFQEAGQTARAQGIKDSVIMCPQCSSVFTIEMDMSGMRLMQDVTATYDVQRKSLRIAKKWWQFCK